MIRIHSLLNPLLLLAVIGLAACDTGVDTTSNPDLRTGDGSYTGPPPITADIRSFQLNFWQFLKEDNRCGQCHGKGQSPMFVNPDDVNKAYSEAIKYANLESPATSEFVSKVGGGHQCWLGDTAACATTVEQMISNWATDSNVTSARLIQLEAPTHHVLGEFKSFPPEATSEGSNGRSFANTVYPLLVGTTPLIANDNCQNCHEEIGPSLPQAPFFASPDVDTAYAAAKSKMNLASPGDSRFVERVQAGHNCWTNCPADATTMQDVIALYAAGIDPTEVDDTLLTSMAVTMADGVIAAGGNRHESNLFALWEFKTRGLGTAYDTSGIEPAIDLTLISDPPPNPVNTVTWLGNYGLRFNGGRAQALTFDSEKMHTFIQATGEYAIEAWVVPSNVTQEDASIVSYSGSDNARNFTLAQDMYNYDFYNRIVADPAEPNGDPALSSGANDEELAQASLQHVVINYDPDLGRSIYINGELVNVTDPVPGSSTINNVWDDGFVLTLGNEISGTRPWRGNMRFLAMHNRNLTLQQVVQNFEVGVGEKYYLLFYIGHQIGIDESYIMFEVSQFDDFSYLFDKPTFINLDPDWAQVSINIAGMRIGINGKESLAGQAFASMNTSVDASYDPQFGQELSPLGTIIPLENGQETDQFFLTFETIGNTSRTFVEPTFTVSDDPSDPSAPISADIGVRTFEEINATIAAMTGVDITNTAVKDVYDDYFQQLPSGEAIDAFLPSHQMAVTQLALTSCSELVEGRGTIAPEIFFPGFDFNPILLTSQSAFGPPPPSPDGFYPDPAPADPDATQLANRRLIIDPLLERAMNVIAPLSLNNLTSQPDSEVIHDMLGSDQTQVLDAAILNTDYTSLIDQMLMCTTPACTPVNSIPRSAQIIKAVCTAAVGGAVMLVQ